MPLPMNEAESAREAYSVIVQMARSTLAFAKAVRTDCISGDVMVTRLVDFYNFLKSVRTQGEGIQNVPGLTEFAAEAVSNPTYDVVAEFTATVAAGEAVNYWLRNNLPGDGAGGVVTMRFATGAPAEHVWLTPAETSDLVVLIDGLIVAIEG